MKDQHHIWRHQKTYSNECFLQLKYRMALLKAFAKSRGKRLFQASSNTHPEIENENKNWNKNYKPNDILVKYFDMSDRIFLDTIVYYSFYSIHSDNYSLLDCQCSHSDNKSKNAARHLRRSYSLIKFSQLKSN